MLLQLKMSLLQPRDFREYKMEIVLNWEYDWCSKRIYHTRFHLVKFEHIFDSAVETDATALHKGYHFIIMSSCQYFFFHFGFAFFPIPRPRFLTVYLPDNISWYRSKDLFFVNRLLINLWPSQAFQADGSILWIFLFTCNTKHPATHIFPVLRYKIWK